MKLTSSASISITALFGLASSFVSFAVTRRLADDNTARQVMYAVACWVGTGLFAMLFLIRAARKAAVSRAWFGALFAFFGLNSFLIGLAAPLFWAFPPTTLLGISIYGYAGLLGLYQLLRAYQHFDRCWTANSASAWTACYSGRDVALDIDGLIRHLHLSVELYLPKPLSALSGVAWCVLVLAILLSLNLRKVHPTYSAIASGIPALTAIVVMSQFALFRVLLASRIRRYERNHHIEIQAVELL